MDDLETIKTELEAVNKRFEEWIMPINQTWWSTGLKVNKDGYTHEDSEREVNDVIQKQLSQYDPYPELYFVIDRLCDFYLDTDPENRAGIRLAVRDKNGIWSGLLNFIYRAAKRLKSRADLESLRRGLAAISIEDCNFDYRDTFIAVAELWVAAERAGIDPRPCFIEAADWSSSDIPRGGTIPVCDLLKGFHRFPVLEERRGKPGLDESPPWKHRVYAPGVIEDSSVNMDSTKKGSFWWKAFLDIFK